jgi:exonuclease SbcC
VRELVSGTKRKLERYRRRLEELRGERTKFQAMLDASRRNFRHIRYEDVRQQSREITVAAAQRLREEYEGIGNLYADAQKRLNSLIALAGELLGAEKLQIAQKTEITTSLARTVQRLNATLAASEFGELAAVEAILAKPINLQTEREALAEYRRRVEGAKVRLLELQHRAAGQVFELATYQALLTQVAQYAQQLTTLLGKKGGLTRDLERLTAELTTKKSLAQQVNALAQRAENLKTLKNMFQASGFVNFISTIFLEQLCAAANERFRRLTRGQLALEIAEGNALQVRDYLHDGQTRSVKTLSGGQTFQAALSLAIALADHVQQQVQAEQKFFFIDEGFGSQDKESLAIIFETLKSLRKENRIVGIISHVEELQQEMDAALYVRQETGVGSVVRLR